MSKFKVGDVCIWQNQVGDWAWLNGIETTITGDIRQFADVLSQEIWDGYQTDTFYPPANKFLGAKENELRLKPGSGTGEKLIRTMFDTIPQRQLVPA